MPVETKNIAIIPAPEGQILQIAGGAYRIIISGEQTNGAYAVIEMTVPPGGGPVPHEHPDILETFYVLEGTVEFTSEAGSQVAEQGTFIEIPLNGPVHCFKNKSQEPARLLCTVMPAGLEAFFREMVLINSTVMDEQEKKEKARAVVEQYGQKLYPPDYFTKGQ